MSKYVQVLSQLSLPLALGIGILSLRGDLMSHVVQLSIGGQCVSIGGQCVDVVPTLEAVKADDLLPITAIVYTVFTLTFDVLRTAERALATMLGILLVTHGVLLGALCLLTQSALPFLLFNQ